MKKLIESLPESKAEICNLFMKPSSFANDLELKEFIGEITRFYVEKMSDEKAIKKWLEPLTTFSKEMNPLYENVPRGLVHEYGIPHGASDALIFSPQLNKFLITTRYDDKKLDGLGGHKTSGLTFFENMIKEILEELYAMDLDELDINKQKEFIKENSLAGEIADRLNFCNMTINENVINGQQNIHVSQLFLFNISQELFEKRVLDPESLTKVEWYSLEKIREKMKTDEARDGFKIVWRNFSDWNSKVV